MSCGNSVPETEGVQTLGWNTLLIRPQETHDLI